MAGQIRERRTGDSTAHHDPAVPAMLEHPHEHRGEHAIAGCRRNGERLRRYAEMHERRPVPFDNGRPGDRFQLVPRSGDLPENSGRLHGRGERACFANRLAAPASSANDGIDSACVTRRSGNVAAGFLNASTNISIAKSVFGGIKMVAASVPFFTHDCPVFGMPSHPVTGIFIHRSRSAPLISLNAFRAPIAMLSSCAPTRSMWLSCDVRNRNHELTVRNALSSVQLARIVLT